VAIEKIGENVGPPFVIGGSYATLVITDAIRSVLAEEQYPVPAHAGMAIPLSLEANDIDVYVGPTGDGELRMEKCNDAKTYKSIEGLGREVNVRSSVATISLGRTTSIQQVHTLKSPA
jgi:hypothetical protein